MEGLVLMTFSNSRKKFCTLEDVFRFDFHGKISALIGYKNKLR